MKKKFVVDVDFTMSRSFEVEADNEQQAKNKVYSMIKKNPYDFTHGFTHCLDYEIVDSNEVVDYMGKYSVEWSGKKFPVRKIQLPEELGGYEANVADVDLWNAIEEDYNSGNSEAHALDNDIFYYCDSGFVASDPTDEEIIEYLIQHGC